MSESGKKSNWSRLIEAFGLERKSTPPVTTPSDTIAPEIERSEAIPTSAPSSLAPDETQKSEPVLPGASPLATPQVFDALGLSGHAKPEKSLPKVKADWRDLAASLGLPVPVKRSPPPELSSQQERPSTSAPAADAPVVNTEPLAASEADTVRSASTESERRDRGQRDRGSRRRGEGRDHHPRSRDEREAHEVRDRKTTSNESRSQHRADRQERDDSRSNRGRRDRDRNQDVRGGEASRQPPSSHQPPEPATPDRTGWDDDEDRLVSSEFVDELVIDLETDAASTRNEGADRRDTTDDRDEARGDKRRRRRRRRGRRSSEGTRADTERTSTDDSSSQLDEPNANQNRLPWEFHANNAAQPSSLDDLVPDGDYVPSEPRLETDSITGETREAATGHTPEETQERKRRRRRRRGGRGRRDREERGSERSDTRDALTHDGAGGEFDAPVDLGSGASPREIDEPHDVEEEAATRAHFRGIPSWEETIGMIVAANLDQRAKNPQSGRGGRGRGGRDRGGRDRGRGRGPRPPNNH